MTTVADLVIANPSSARVFERHGIDYCCNGQRPFDEACADAGVDALAVQAELAALEEPVESTIPEDPVALIGQIVATHHRFLRRELPRLNDLMAKVVAAHSDTHPETHEIAATLDAITVDLLPHLMKEEKVLFPLAIELLGALEPTVFHCGSVLNPISVMNEEHDIVGELLARLRHQTDSYTPPQDACPTWIALYAGLAELESDTHTHVHLENNVLFPMMIGLESSLQ